MKDTSRMMVLKNRKNRTAATAQEQEKQSARRRSNRRRPVQLSQSTLDWRKREENSKTTTGASCKSKPSPESQIESCVKDGRLQLTNGQSLTNALCAVQRQNQRTNLLLCHGCVGNQLVKVLRDIGCNCSCREERPH